MVPLAFPLVMVVPALAIDVINQRAGSRHPWLLSALFAAAFVAAMLLVHWPFGTFMLTPAARNWVFAADQWPYMYEIREWTKEFWWLDAGPAQFLGGLGLALIFATLSARVGLAWGEFTRRLLR
jgi:hypothetical protein